MSFLTPSAEALEIDLLILPGSTLRFKYGTSN